MKQFPSIEKLDTAILYTLELASSLSILLLAFGLTTSMANVLTKGTVLYDMPPPWMAGLAVLRILLSKRFVTFLTERGSPSFSFVAFCQTALRFASVCGSVSSRQSSVH